MRCLFAVVCQFALTMAGALGCIDTPATDGGGGVSGRGGTGGSTPRVIDEPGECFEVFGPPGVSHSAPRAHDMGVVEVGDSRDVSVRFYNFCHDVESVILETIILDEGGLRPSDDFVITSAPIPAAQVSLENEYVEVTLSARVSGWHRARIRYRVSHGYYDFDLVAEAVEPGGRPVPFEADCLEIGPSETFAGGTIGQPMTERLDISSSCEAVVGATHVVLESYELAGNEHGAFAVHEADVGKALVCGQPVSEGACEDIALSPRVIFKPPSEGEFESVLTIVTNEPNGEHEVILLGSTGN